LIVQVIVLFKVILGFLHIQENFNGSNEIVEYFIKKIRTVSTLVAT
jgi:hypothetical protein